MHVRATFPKRAEYAYLEPSALHSSNEHVNNVLLFRPGVYNDFFALDIDGDGDHPTDFEQGPLDSIRVRLRRHAGYLQGHVE